MNPVREALYERLSGDGPLEAVVGERIHHQRVPQGGTFPAVVFHKQAGTPQHTFAGGIKNELWVVKAIDKSASASTAEQIAGLIESALHDAPLSIDGHDHLYLRRESDIDYPEQNGADLYHHVGGVYRLYTEPA